MSRRSPGNVPGPHHGIARVLSKQGLCSRTEAARWIQRGRVSMDGQTVLDPEFPFRGDPRRIAVDGASIIPVEPVYLMLNKPRGLVTTVKDEQSRDTVYRCLQDQALPWLAPVGRLDKASEGLLLFSNDPKWAAAITEPESGIAKTYHVQVDAIPGTATLAAMTAGVDIEGSLLQARSAHLLRTGTRNAWIEVVLDEGRNRQIRRMLAALELQVLRLVRVAVGPLALGTLAKGAWRFLTDDEAGSLAPLRPLRPFQR